MVLNLTLHFYEGEFAHSDLTKTTTKKRKWRCAGEIIKTVFFFNSNEQQTGRRPN